MNEDQDKPEEQLSEEPQFAEVKQPGLRKISAEELKKILEDHQKYCESEGKDDKIANLSDADLSRANLRGANLSWADLSGVNFEKAKLTHFSHSDISGYISAP